MQAALMGSLGSSQDSPGQPRTGDRQFPLFLIEAGTGGFWSNFMLNKKRTWAPYTAGTSRADCFSLTDSEWG